MPRTIKGASCYLTGWELIESCALNPVPVSIVRVDVMVALMLTVPALEITWPGEILRVVEPETCGVGVAESGDLPTEPLPTKFDTAFPQPNADKDKQIMMN